jgi:hypothetical protein
MDEPAFVIREGEVYRVGAGVQRRELEFVGETADAMSMYRHFGMTFR